MGIEREGEGEGEGEGEIKETKRTENWIINWAGKYNWINSIIKHILSDFSSF